MIIITDGPGEDNDWVAPHQNTVSHVDPHAPLAGLPPGEGNGSSCSCSLQHQHLSVCHVSRVTSLQLLRVILCIISI